MRKKKQTRAHTHTKGQHFQFWYLLLLHVITNQRIIYQKICWISVSLSVRVRKCYRRLSNRQAIATIWNVRFPLAKVVDFNDKLCRMFPNWFIMLHLRWLRRNNKSTRKDKQLSFQFNRGFKCKLSHFHDSFEAPDEISHHIYSNKSKD